MSDTKQRRRHGREEVQITFTRAQLRILSELLWHVYREQHARKVRGRERTLEWCQFFETWADG